ncbi:MAG TPA: hypothetical protein PLF30_00540 [Candidatus Moranbacteria bacterium]|jgi:uncharacterized membrane protein YcjF (UPF0283 family)|nr:hypothetical protein [Candidatus Moranbacteria bacterium]HOF42407.1 hypothetical protein [Candidatus Moranbacteria bacterium]HPX94041.1 hypothetical protein [Candidatus Moranbacteria bacterium]
MKLSYRDCENVVNNMTERKNGNWIRMMLDAMEVAFNAKSIVYIKIKSIALKLGKKIAGIYLAVIGLIFLLIAASLLINSFLSENLDWIGWGATGLVMAAVGYYFFSRG